jgi:hypothetical protein
MMHEEVGKICNIPIIVISMLYIGKTGFMHHIGFATLFCPTLKALLTFALFPLA